MKPKFLLVTTDQDLSLPYFLDDDVTKLFDVVVVDYDDDLEQFKSKTDPLFDVIYLRDPFNKGDFNLDNLQLKVDYLANQQTEAKYVDSAKNLQDLLFEDKFSQYGLLSEFMPKTEQLLEASQFEDDRHIIKKSISARSRDIAFQLETKHLNGQFIVQPIIEILDEYRVYIVNGKVLGLGTKKSSKTANNQVKVLKLVDLPEAVIELAAKVADKLSVMNLLGLDIATRSQDKPVLIEANRSPQFKRFNELAGFNLAIELLKDFA
jgi:glutathione synthase/RimK-type ligase-like ATP-grasp enzyme